MILVGLTGNIGSGKSTVARLFEERGATIIDADVLARRAVEPGTVGLRRLVELWGEGILSPDGALDRAALRHRVFEAPEELERLNAIVHPEVERLRDAEFQAAVARGEQVVVYDVPLLFERHLADRFDVIVLVDAPRPLRLERLVRDRDLREDEAMAMIAAQMPAELKRARADFIIDNDGTLADLEDRAGEVWESLQQMVQEPAGIP
ncbi:MAG TPA: dephospho-CoA kinase [Gemmatimonadaceae bacterium]|nr:dephospho-CoA kinase [Gemmatimonadaceae bacterium]